MSQCVPSWDLVDRSVFPVPPSVLSQSNFTGTDDSIPLLDYEVAELTWENGQVATHGFGLPRLSMKLVSSTEPAKYMWEKPRASGTLESIVNQVAYAPPQSNSPFNGGAKSDDLVPWFDEHRSGSALVTMAMDALVPCSNRTDGPVAHLIDASLVGGSIDRVGSSSVAETKEPGVFPPVKRARVARVSSPPEWSSRDQSVSGSATFEKDSQPVSFDTYDGDLCTGFTSTSPENTSSGKPFSKSTTVDDHDSVCHSRPQRNAGEDDDKKKDNGKSSVSTKRSRAAAVHNQSERKRRDKINEKMQTLQKLVPNSSKTDKASMLDEVIEYLKQLQAQVQMMRMNMPAPSMTLPMVSMQQQLQMSMLQASMGLGPMIGAMGMGMGMDMNSIGRANISGIPPVLHPAAFMLVNPWDSSGDRLQAPSTALIPDPLSTFLPCQSQPMNMDAYYRLAAMYQQFHQPPLSSSKN